MEFACMEWGKEWKNLVRLACVVAKIWSGHLSDTGVECYHYTNLLIITVYCMNHMILATLKVKWRSCNGKVTGKNSNHFVPQF
jgi:hypothetical protein